MPACITLESPGARLHHRHLQVPMLDHPVPAWMRDFVLIFIARALGMCDTARTYQEAKDVAAAAARTERHRPAPSPT